MIHVDTARHVFNRIMLTEPEIPLRDTWRYAELDAIQEDAITIFLGNSM